MALSLDNMKIKAKTGFKVVFWAFAIFTIASYIWAIASLILIVKYILL